jgi:hypothetical protein
LLIRWISTSTSLGNPATDPNANARFSALMNEFGAAISNWNLEPPETTGFAGFNFAFEMPISLINGSGQVQGVNYWPSRAPLRTTS